MGGGPHSLRWEPYFVSCMNFGTIYNVLIFPEVGIDDADFDGVFQQIKTIMDIQFIHEAGSVLFHSLRADAENVGDLAGGVALGHQTKDLLLTLAEKIVAAHRGNASLRLDILSDHFRLQSGAEEIFTPVGSPDRIKDIQTGRGLEDITQGARRQRLLYVGFLGVHGQDHNL